METGHERYMYPVRCNSATDLKGTFFKTSVIYYVFDRLHCRTLAIDSMLHYHFLTSISNISASKDLDFEEEFPSRHLSNELYNVYGNHIYFIG